MKVALVHDYLNQYGGAERVLEVLCEMFPDAPIYTLLYDEKRSLGRFKNRVIKTSIFNTRLIRRNHRLFIPFMPILIRLMKIPKEYDLVISDTAGFAKGVRYSKRSKHLCYCYTPLRYAWETDGYFNDSFDGARVFKSRLFRVVFKPLFLYVKRFDYLSSKKPDVMLAVSQFISKKIWANFNREAEVLYPPVLDVFYSRDNLEKKDYYLVVGRMLHYKRLDLVVRAFNQMPGKKLLVVGSGRDEVYLRSLITSKNIKQLSSVNSDEDLARIYAQAKAFIMPNEEDFGLVMAEALASKTPVIAFGSGGALELVNESNGILFHEATVRGLKQAVEAFEKRDFSLEIDTRFTKENFKKNLQEKIDKLLLQKK